MSLNAVHVLLTYQCTQECDHCFVWGGPGQTGTFTLRDIDEVLLQAREVGTVEWIYFEGGEPFLHYPLLVRAVERAAKARFRVGLVTNAFWASDEHDAHLWLTPMAGRVQDLSVSNDLYHWDTRMDDPAENAMKAAQSLGIPCGFIRVAQPEATDEESLAGGLLTDENEVLYRGRAAEKLAWRTHWRSWEEFRACPHEPLDHPTRVHVDPHGHVHVCQGITIGNINERPLRELMEGFDPASHPILAPLLEGGPAELARRHGAKHPEKAADACHLCYQTRLSLRSRFPGQLAPDQMYGEARPCQPPGFLTNPDRD